MNKPSLHVTLTEADTLERQKAMRALLARPVIHASGETAESYRLIRAHEAWLSSWLASNTGWRLRLDTETARLRKTPADLRDGTRPARDAKSGDPFSRRRYVMLCLALAGLERSDRQTTLHNLAEHIEALFVEDPELTQAGMTFDLSQYNQRRDLVAAVRLLLAYQVLIRVHGEEDHFVKNKGDVLYNINRPVLAGLLNVHRGPSTVDDDHLTSRMSQIVHEPLPDTDEGRNRRIRFKLTRILLDDPVLYLKDLTEEECAYWQSQRPFILRRIEEATGLIPEVRLEGMAMVDDKGDMTDLSIPEEGTNGHLVLLLAEYLAAAIRKDASAVVTRADLERHTVSLIQKHGKYWRKDVMQPGAERVLTAMVVNRLAALRLVECRETGIRPLPAIARFSCGTINQP